MNNITELRQTGENNWVAKYQGNYGMYTIRITTEGKKAKKFSCSCPSDNYPCKHIAMIEKAIAEEIALRKKQEKRGGARVEDLIRNVPEEQLREFITVQSKYIPELLKAVVLEFPPEAENKKNSTYHTLLRNALSSIWADEGDYYSEESQDIDVLDDLLDKARDYLKKEQYDKAILVCKAIIEEYSDWLAGFNNDDIFYVYSPDYQSDPFMIMEAAAKHTDKKELFNYCMSEVKKKKYAKTDFNDYFHLLLEKLANGVDPDAFIALQDRLFEGARDKTGTEAEKILRRKVDFFRRNRQPDKAWAILEENIQIESFRKETVKEKIKQQNFSDAKKLIADYFKKNVGKKKDTFDYYDDSWNELLLEIAQKEKDIPAVQDLSFGLIKWHFNKKYFTIYKAAFTPAEWPAKREELLARYAGKDYYGESAAELLKAENDAEGLLAYMEKHLSLEMLEEYYKIFAPGYPERTLTLFHKAINKYVEKNTGRSHYEYIVTVFRKIIKISGGKKFAASVVEDYIEHYKNRKTMIEVLKQFQKNSL